MHDGGARARHAGAPRRRLVRHYLPLVMATVGAMAVLVSVPFFDVNRYPPPGDIFAEGAKGALPDGDYPPPGAEPAGDPSTSDEPDSGGTGAPPTTAAHAGRPAGGHGADSTATTAAPPTTTAPDRNGRPDGDHTPATTTPGGADGSDTGAAAPTTEHAGDQDSVLRMRRLSTMTGYLALALIALTLLLGPWNLLLGRRLPVSSYLRRDVGIWSALTSVAHVVLGFLVEHGDGDVLGYFVAADDRSRILTNSFGLANWAGLAAVVIAVGLAAISSDAALRKLKAARWKRLQRANYLLAVLAVLHAVLYGAFWRLTSPYTVTLLASVVIVVVAQAMGVRRWRRRRLPAPTGP